MLRSLTTQALRHRPGQAIVLVALSALITGAAVIGPLYERAIDEVVLRTTLTGAPVSATGFSLHRIALLRAGGPNAVLPANVRGLYGAAIHGSDALVGLVSDQGTADVSIASRDDVCAHLTIVAGSCPTSGQDVAVSATTAKIDGLRLGGSIHLSITIEGIGAHQPTTLRVSGIYARFDPHSAYWFDHPYVGDGRSAAEPDAIFAGDGQIQAVVRQIIERNGVDVPIDSFDDLPLHTDLVGVGQTAALSRAVTATVTRFADDTAEADTQLDALLAGASADRRQVHQVVPLFAGELVLLALALLLFLVNAAAAQRRPEVALARLRGQRRSTAIAPMLVELGSAVVLGAPLGLLVAIAGLVVAGHTWLPSTAGISPPWTSLVAWAAALFAQLLVIVVVARQLGREPVVTLLRGVPVRRSAVRIGSTEVGVAVLALAAVLTVLTSGLSGPVALLAPGLLALAIGLLLGAAVPVLADRAGRQALKGGRVRIGLTALQLGRRPGARGVLVVLVVASAVLVATADTWHVAVANRAARAALDVGAPAVLETGAPSARALLSATDKLDPSGRAMVPVVVVAPPTLGVTLLATRPQQAAAIAHWGWPRQAPSRSTLALLRPTLPPPIVLTGGSVEVRLSAVRLVGGKPSELDIDVVGADGSPASYDLGTLPPLAVAVDLRATIPCQSGCRWQGLSVVRSLADTTGQYGQLVIDSVAMHPRGTAAGSGDGTPITIGPAAQWHSSTPTPTPRQAQDLANGITTGVAIDPNKLPPPTLLGLVPHLSGSLAVRFFDTAASVSLVHGDVPAAIPALTTTPARTSTPSITFDGGRLDGATQLFDRIGAVPVMPGVSGNAALADIDILARLADKPVSFTSYDVWLADAAPTSVARARAGLVHLGVPVYGVSTIAARKRALGNTGPALSLQVGLISGAVGLLVAMGVLLITTITTVQSRRYDVAALRLSGVPRAVLRAALIGEGVALSLIGVIVGSACGVAGGRLQLRAAPFLTGGTAFPAHRTFTAWWLVAAVFAVAVALLTALSVGIGRAIVRRAGSAVIRLES